MDSETANALIARTSALERIAILLIADRLKRLDDQESLMLKVALSGPVPLAQTANLDDADDLAGRVLLYRETMNRILAAAQEIAAIGAD